MEDWVRDVIWIGLTVVLVLINGFFVAAEFALVKVRKSRLEALVRERRAFAQTALWLMRRLDRALSACQLGITMASLALGWVGEPAIARLMEPLFIKLGLGTGATLHTVSFIVGFTIITAAHLVIGEQVPKIFALRRAEQMSLRCAVLLKWFYLISYPFQVALSAATSLLLRRLGVAGGEHDDPHSEEEIRALLSLSHSHGDLTRSEHQLLQAVFDFDDRLCRQIMVPRTDVDFLDVEDSREVVMGKARATRHTRYPVCERSLDSVLGFVHMKDLLIGAGSEGDEHDGTFDLRNSLRPPLKVPETMPIGQLLKRLQAVRNHLAFVIDEHGTVTGIVTMENVLEQLIGPVQDEFDDETPMIVPDGAGRFLVGGGTPLTTVNQVIGLDLTSESSDTLAGLVMERLNRVPRPGDVAEFESFTAEVTEVHQSRADRIRLTMSGSQERSE